MFPNAVRERDPGTESSHYSRGLASSSSWRCRCTPSSRISIALCGSASGRDHTRSPLVLLAAIGAMVIFVSLCAGQPAATHLMTRVFAAATPPSTSLKSASLGRD